MAYISIPKDLSRIKNKVVFSLTKRQLICFGSAAIIGIPAYIFTRGTIGNSAAVILMIVLMLPFFFIAMYEKDNQPAEKILRNYLRARFLWARIRPYKTENLYEIIETEGKISANKNKTTATTPVGKRPSGKK
jgi:hypothetical protein